MIGNIIEVSLVILYFLFNKGVAEMKLGERIRDLRTRNYLTQEELADRCELTKGFISQLERDLTSPSIATLVDILDALGTNLREFFTEDEEEKVVFSTEDTFMKIDEEHGYSITWLIPNAQKNAMEPILAEILPGGETKEDSPHEGEEFGYVLSGSIELIRGREVQRLAKGDSFYFKSRSGHRLKNTGKKNAVVIWVSSPPSF